MKLLTIYNDGIEYSYYDINSIIKLNTIKDQLRDCLQKSIETYPSINQDPNEHLSILEHQLRIRNEKFKLLVVLKDKILVAFMAVFITEESSENVALIYAAYFKPGLVNKILEDFLRFLDTFASENMCNRMSFLTARDEKPFARLLRKYNFIPTRTVFERKIAI